MIQSYPPANTACDETCIECSEATDMAAETPPTGMDHAEMKRFLLKSKQEPVNCALGIGDDKSVALLMLSPHRSAKSLQGDLQKQFPTAFNTRFGTAMVDTDDDPTLVKFMLNKAVTSMARRLVKTLKGTGFRKVQILLGDGTPVETAAEEEGAQQGGAPGSATEGESKPDASALAQALAALVRRIADVAMPRKRRCLPNRRAKPTSTSRSVISPMPLSASNRCAARSMRFRAAAIPRPLNRPKPSRRRHPLHRLPRRQR